MEQIFANIRVIEGVADVVVLPDHGCDGEEDWYPHQEDHGAGGRGEASSAEVM